MKTLKFIKMHGLGNDFMVVDGTNQVVDLKEITIQKLANRHIGVGFDQLLIIEKTNPTSFFCRIYNADGSEAEQCGNGLRCVARYLHEEGVSTKRHFELSTKAGIFPLHIDDYDHIHVTMGKASIKENLINVTVKQQIIPMSILSLGNPHAIIKIDNINFDNATNLAGHIANLNQFPDGVNVGFVQVLDPEHIRLRTFERGSGETYACGSNACAAVVSGINNGWLKEKVEVEFRHGNIQIEWKGHDHPIVMTGPAERVFRGEVVLTSTK